MKEKSKKMNNETLLYLCHFTIFFAVVIGGSATLGKFYFEKQITKDKEAATVATATGTVQSERINKNQKPQITNFHSEGNSGNGIYIRGMDVDINGGTAKNNGGDGLRIEQSKSNLPKKKRGK